MTRQLGANFGCLVVGDYVDEADAPADAVYGGEVIRPQLAADCVDLWTSNGADKDFTVLLRDNRMVKVTGYRLSQLNGSGNPGDSGSYAIIAHGGDCDVTIALFRIADVTGIFHGELRLAQDGS